MVIVKRVEDGKKVALEEDNTVMRRGNTKAQGWHHCIREGAQAFLTVRGRSALGGQSTSSHATF